MDIIRAGEVKTVAIAGAGLMGASMAQIFAAHGRRVAVYDISADSIERGRELIDINQRAGIREGKLCEAASRELVGRISFSGSPDVLGAADFVIECIVESMDAKKAFWAEASEIARPEAALATNTSGLSINGIAAAVKAPERFAGMHWVNPPHLIPLVEVIAGDRTAAETMDTVYELALSVGRRPVRVRKDAKGFVLNRLQFAMLREAMHIVESGIADMEDVDSVVKHGLGLRYACLGPFETADLGGLDTFCRIAEYLFADLSDAKSPQGMLAGRYRAGEYGAKSGKGFYGYPGDGAERAVSERDGRLMRLAECLYGRDGTG
ncbi:MAG: 3-hydroxyacyl-CoA dehydrogenase family protein [Clostridiales Family XIII bacterium]|nr:3-hydroxyacyl-CoA dehydrogenase family protein [Clostridiales Family XIII bacterium]